MLVRLARSDGTEQVARVPAHDPRFVVTASPSALEVVQTYTVLGIEHILTGFDHLCFVLALVMIVGEGMHYAVGVAARALPGWPRSSSATPLVPPNCGVALIGFRL